MIIITTADKVAPIFKNYRDVAAFSLGEAKGFVDEEAQIKVGYKMLTFLPSNDTINAVMNGDESGKKVIKKAVKNIQRIKMDEDNTGIAMSVAQLVNIIQDNDNVPENMSKKAYKKYLKKHGPNVLVFVLDGKDESRDKFLTKFIKAIFGVYGYDCITERKAIKKLFDHKRKKVNDKVRAFIENNKSMRISKDGRALLKVTKIYYTTELLQVSMSGSKEYAELDKKSASRLARALTGQFSNLNILELEKMNFNKKTTKDLAKKMNKKNKKSVEYYDEIRDMLAGSGVNLPKVEFGVKKKTRNSDNPKPKMNVDKFIKFYRDKDNRAILRLVYVHITCRHLGVEIGTSSYNKNVSAVLSEEFGGDFAKAFTATAKAYAKSQPIT